MNEKAKQMIRSERFANIGTLLRQYHWICDEINEYNVTYWSKFLFVFWLTNGINLILFLFITVFSSMELFLRIIIVIVAIEFTLSFLLLIFNASSVNLAANNSYKTFNSLILHYCHHNKHFRIFRFQKKVYPYELRLFYL